MKIPRTRDEKLKLFITAGMVTPSFARLVFPDSAEAASFANLVTLLAGLVWLWEC